MGRGHSFNDICDTRGTLINLTRKMSEVLALDEAAGTLRVQGGITYTQMFEHLRHTEWALPNTASMPHFSLAGAISTGVHGSSGVDASGRPPLANLGSAVRALTFVVHDGSVVRYSRDDTDGGARLDAAICGLGCLGVVAEAELQLVPTYNVAQACYHDIPAQALVDNFMDLLAAHDSLSCFVDWRLHNVRWLWARRFVAAGDTAVPAYPAALLGGRLEERSFGRRGADGVYRGSLATVTGLWSDVLPFNMPALATREELALEGGRGRRSARESERVTRFDDSAEMDEIQAEYFVPLSAAVPALEVTYTVAQRWTQTAEGAAGGAPICKHCELRVVRGDGQLLSTARGRDSLVIHFSFAANTADGAGNMPLAMAWCAELEAALRPWDVRPHWGKLFAMGRAELRRLYGAAALDAFATLCAEHDPNGRFVNDWAARLVLGEEGEERPRTEAEVMEARAAGD
jgi:xylitol oxidase